MVNRPGDTAARLREVLARFTQREVIVSERGGRVSRIPPSQREISRLTGFPRSTLGDFIRDPERASARTLARIEALLDDPRLQVRYDGERVTYVDAPRWTSDTLANMRVPRGATAFRIVSATDDEHYRGFRSSGWLADFDDIGGLAATVPGGLDAVERIVFDVER